MHHVHYLRKERSIRALTQRDVSALLGCPWKSRVSRYERSQKLPPIEVALAFEVIMHKPVAELFQGAYASIQSDVRERARQLLEEQVRATRHERRCRSLRAILTA